MIKRISISLLLLVGLCACMKIEKPEDNKSKTELQFEEYWKNLFGEVNPEETWNNFAEVNLEIRNAGEATVSIFSLGEEKRTIFATEKVNGSSSISFSMPMGMQNGVAVCCESAEGTVWKAVGMNQLLKGNVAVDMQLMSLKSSETKAQMSEANRKALTKATLVDPRTNKKAKIYGYTNFPAWIWYDMNMAIPEDTRVDNSQIVTNFELQSKGKFYVSTIYGATGTSSAEIGYYFYDKSNPSDITYVPLVNALSGDYWYDNDKYTADNALAKVQWLDKDTNSWVDANFCFYDQVDGMKNANFNSRKEDDIYNVLSIEKTYGGADPEQSRIGMVRGLTFQVDAPEGNMVGFYCKNGGLVNHSTKALNAKGNERAGIKIYDGFRFIGLEDGNQDSTKEPDCNDIAFVMVAGNDGALPGLLLPYIKDVEEDKYLNGDGTKTEEPKYDFVTDGATEDELYKNIGDLSQSNNAWTVAFEDMTEKGDLDFNDVVLAVLPNINERKADVVICATGGSIKADLYYEDKFIGEVHDLLGSVSGGRYVIANTYTKKFPVKKIMTIDWAPNDKVEEMAKKFCVRTAQNELRIPERGNVPNAICVAGLWAWPKEATDIHVAYPEFAKWAESNKNLQSNGWYKKFDENKVVKFE